MVPMFELVSLILVLVYVKEGFTHNDGEHELMNYLFTSSKYQKDVRPVKNASHSVNLDFGISYIELESLDDVKQVLTSSVWVRQIWKNEFLTWDPLLFDNVTEINLSPKNVWLPDIMLYNNAVEGMHAGTLYNFYTKVKVRFDGVNTWYAPAVFRSSCSIDITWFPFDHQFCHLKFGSWTYHAAELDINIELDHKEADRSFYLESDDFDLLAAPVIKIIGKYDCCPERYPVIQYTIAISRKSGFHFYHIILPSLFMTFLTLLSFDSPHFIGERVVLAIESFLTLTFSLILVSEKMPMNSDATPLITKLILSCMLFQTAILFCNIFSTQLGGAYPIPLNVRILCFRYLAPYIGLGEFNYLSIQNDEIAKRNNRLMMKPFDSSLSLEEKSQVEAAINLKLLLRSMQVNDKTDKNKQFWFYFTKTLDRFFFLVFSVGYLFSTLYVYLKNF